MRADTLERHREQAVTLLAALNAAKLARTLRGELNGYPAGRGLDAGPRGNSELTPTEAAALAPDRAHEDLRELNQLIPQIARIAARLATLQATWCAPPRRAQCQHCGDPTGSHQKTHCRWCSGFLADIGRLPDPQELATRAAGRSVKAGRFARRSGAAA